MPVRVGIVRECDAELILEPDEPRHGVRARGIHADLAVMITVMNENAGSITGLTTVMLSL